MTAAKPLISLEDIGVAVQNQWLIKNITLSIYANDVISLIGPNGAGKSTLVKVLLGLIKPSAGMLTCGKNLRTSYVPQQFNLPATLPLSVQDLLNQSQHKRLSDDERAAIFANLHLPKLLKKQVAALSGGELQRVLLGKALLEKPNLLVLDEPMQGLDPEAQTLLYGLLDSLPEFLRCAMLVVSHDLHWVMKGTKQVLCLNKHICCQGMPADIAQTPAFVALFGNYQTHAYEMPYIHQTHTCAHH